jgi:ubiquinone/menaquinone biosynthesis C-methylase UbiE
VSGQSLDAIAARADLAVAELRDGAGTLDKLLFHDGPELMDLESTPQRLKERLVSDADRIIRMLQLHRLWTWRVGRIVLEARRTRRGKPVRVLDVGAGAGGLLFRLEDWARRRRVPIELHGVDSNAGYVEATRRRAEEEGRRVELHLGDARDLDRFADGSMDVVVSTLMLHHLRPGEAARTLAEMDRVAAVNFFAFDLTRSVAVLPVLWSVLHLARFDAPTRHDAITSVRRGYTLGEMEELLRAAGVAGFQVEELPPAFLVATRA